MDEQQLRREDARHAVLAALHTRCTGAFPAATVRTVFLKGHDFDLSEVRAALQYLLAAGLVQSLPDPLGATPAYQITAAGILAHERRPS
ncbi:MAG: hypothetical protein EBR82_23490 [Caulobacteraceae bacterium]|nr:hypothetical protein [Caulobacteraceae bacterium]